MIRSHGSHVPRIVRSRLQPLLELVADDHPSAPLLPGLGPEGIDEARTELPVLAQACRTGALALLADGLAPTPTTLAQRLCELRGYRVDSIGVAITDSVEALCREGGVDQVIADHSRLTMLALAEALIGIAQLMAAPTGDAPSTMVAMMLEVARTDDESDPAAPADRASGGTDEARREREAS